MADVWTGWLTSQRPAEVAAMLMVIEVLLFLVLAWAFRREHRNTLAALRESEQRYRLAITNAVSAVAINEMVLDEHGKALDFIWRSANPAFDRHTGMCSRELIGQRASALFPGIQQTEFFRTVAEVVRTGRSASFEFHFEPLGRQYVCNAYHIDGAHFGVIFVDVTERVKTMQELTEAKEALEAAVAHTPAGIMIADAPDCRIRIANPAAFMLPEDEPRVLRSEEISQLLDRLDISMPDRTPCPWNELPLTRAVVDGEVTRARELLVRDDNDEEHWVSATASPIYDAHGGIAAGILVFHDITERRMIENELRFAAENDALTGLANRALLTTSLKEAVREANTGSGRGFSVLFLDFDRFKVINDSLGHLAGDRLLMQVAHRLTSNMHFIKASDPAVEDFIVARQGGDEFVILVQGAGVESRAAELAKQLLTVLAEPYDLGEHQVMTTASIGVVTSDMGYDSADVVLRDADTAMYEAKANGRSRYAIFNQSMWDRAAKRLRIENELRTAIDSHQFALVYQPIVNLESGRLESLEALIRWEHPERGVVSPIDFIPIAEETGLIIPIGEWVIEEACRQFARWRGEMGERAPRSVSVNLARQQLIQPDLPSKIRGTLDRLGMPPECLHLEVTEREIMGSLELAQAAIRELRDMGVRIDMDDFGTGHSSLACLHEFPIDVLKMDRMFVANINRGRDYAALAHAVIELAVNLGIRVVAEGIETKEQLLMLQSMSCDLGQGYLFSRPLPPDEVPSFMRHTVATDELTRRHRWAG